jgi:hypothetical protein
MARRPQLPLNELERLLSERPPNIAAAVRLVVNDLRPCVRLDTSRANEVPIKGRLLDPGLLAVDLTPGSILGNPMVSRASDRGSGRDCVGCRGEVRSADRFRGSWSLRGLEWFDAIPKEDDELWTWMNEFEVPGVDEDARGGHKLFGHPNEVLNEHYGFTPVAGRSDSIREYGLI